MSDYVPTDDRAKWPADAVAVAVAFDVPDGSWYLGVINWPPENAYADEFELPRQPRGQRSWRWGRCTPVTGSPPNQRKWVFAQVCPEREGVIKSGGTARRDVLIPSVDPMERRTA